MICYYYDLYRKTAAPIPTITTTTTTPIIIPIPDPPLSELFPDENPTNMN